MKDPRSTQRIIAGHNNSYEVAISVPKPLIKHSKGSNMGSLHCKVEELVFWCENCPKCDNFNFLTFCQKRLFVSRLKLSVSCLTTQTGRKVKGETLNFQTFRLLERNFEIVWLRDTMACGGLSNRPTPPILPSPSNRLQ